MCSKFNYSRIYKYLQNFFKVQTIFGDIKQFGDSTSKLVRLELKL